MSVTDDSSSSRIGTRHRDVNLECLYDDASDPTELTVFAPESDSMATEWITVDRTAAVALDRML